MNERHEAGSGHEEDMHMGKRSQDDYEQQDFGGGAQSQWQGGPHQGGAPGGGGGWQQAAGGPGGWGNTSEQKSVALATALSMLPGLGQIYVGFYQRGFINIGVVAATISLLNQWELRAFQPLLGIFLPFFWIYNMIDAARCAQAVNRALRGGKPIDLPELPTGVLGNSRFAGMILVGMGVILLGVTVFDFDLGWIRDWWPVLLIVFGVRLITKDRRPA